MTEQNQTRNRQTRTSREAWNALAIGAAVMIPLISTCIYCICKSVVIERDTLAKLEQEKSGLVEKVQSAEKLCLGPQTDGVNILPNYDLGTNKSYEVGF
jgi:hypothetical protein